MLTYEGGRTQAITLITKDISIPYSEDESLLRSNGVSFLEIIPKEIVPDASQLNLITRQYTVLEKDTMLEFPADTATIAYYVNQTINLGSTQSIDTVIMDRNIKIETPTG